MLAGTEKMDFAIATLAEEGLETKVSQGHVTAESGQVRNGGSSRKDMNGRTSPFG